MSNFGFDLLQRWYEKLFSFLQTVGFDDLIRLSRTTRISSTSLEGRAAWRSIKLHGRLFRMAEVTVT